MIASGPAGEMRGDYATAGIECVSDEGRT
jgi:hypothetical protein